MNEMSFWRVTAKASWACERWWMFRALQVVHNVRNTEHEAENSKKWDRAESRERSGYKWLYLPCKYIWILCWDPRWAAEGFLSRRIVWSANNFVLRISQSLLALGRSREKQIKRQRKSWEAITRWSCQWSQSQSEGAKKKKKGWTGKILNNTIGRIWFQVWARGVENEWWQQTQEDKRFGKGFPTYVELQQGILVLELEIATILQWDNSEGYGCFQPKEWISIINIPKLLQFLYDLVFLLLSLGLLR